MPAAHVPTEESREKVKSFAAVGIPQTDIARVLDIDPKTLRLHYRDEIDTASTLANATIAGALFSKAKNGDTAAAIFWCKTRLGWSEKQVIDNNINTTTHHQIDEETRGFFDRMKKKHDVKPEEENTDEKDDGTDAASA